MQTILYEDDRHGDFGPPTLLRSEFDLLCGGLALREKLERRWSGDTVALLARPGLREVSDERHPGRGIESIGDEPTLFLSGRVVVDDLLLSTVREIGREALLSSGGEVIGAVVEASVPDRAAEFADCGADTRALSIGERSEVPARLVARPWDLVRIAAEEIARDAKLVSRYGEIAGTVHEGAYLIEPARISVGEGSAVSPGAVLDASEGPVIIGGGATVMANAVVVGPAWIGDGTIVKAGARIYGGCAIGPVCKVGGEIEGSVFQGWSNKQHEGFLGHSCVGSWVNLGAATDTSDLKNNYASVRVRMGGTTIDTGSAFVGATIGDHTKTAIGTKLNTGTVLGAFCNIVSAGFPPKYVPSFSWITPEAVVEYELGKALETARLVMGRRAVEMSAAEEALVRSLFESSRPERSA